MKNITISEIENGYLVAGSIQGASSGFGVGQKPPLTNYCKGIEEVQLEVVRLLKEPELKPEIREQIKKPHGMDKEEKLT